MNTGNEGFVGNLNQEQTFAESTTSGPTNFAEDSPKARRAPRTNSINPALRNIKEAIAKLQAAKESLSDLDLKVSQHYPDVDDLIKAVDEVASGVIASWGDRAAAVARKEAIAAYQPAAPEPTTSVEA